jgi:hypothetical protein
MSSAFKSMVPQRTRPLPTVDNPGPGAYNPNDTSTIEHLPGANPESNIVSKVGRDTRFGGDTVIGVDPHIGATVGPGSYESHVDSTIAKASSSLEERTDRYRSGNSSSAPLGTRAIIASLGPHDARCTRPT